MAAFSFSNSSAGRLAGFIGRLSKSRFFAISVALHFILVLTGGSVVLFQSVTQKTNVDTEAGGELVQAQAAPQTEQIQQLAQPADPTVTQAINQPSAVSLSAITSLNTTNTAFSLPSVATDTPQVGRTFDNPTQSVAPNTPPTINGIPRPIAQGMVKFTQGWSKPGETGSGVGKSRHFKFTAFLAKYEGGDWDSTIVRGPDGKITKGSFLNLLFVMRKWSGDKIDADPEPVPLDLASDEIFAKKPPFILFTGHRDFVLSVKEVDNLRKYLQLGGCIWGDSSLPGNRSRFDIAFRREMKRVLPDQDINWEVLPPDHPIFTKTYYPEINKVPSGLNYVQEPVYALKNFGEVSVIYTANDYCDMWQIGVDEKGEYDLRLDEKLDYAVTNRPMYWRRDVYFRNLELKPLNDSYKFGTNVVLHLLTRWEDKLRNVPTGL